MAATSPPRCGEGRKVLRRSPLVFGEAALYTRCRKQQSTKPREKVMPRRSMVASVSFLVVTALLAGTGKIAAQTGSPALTGKVTAGQDALEGVLVSAKKSGSPVTGPVVSDKARRE